MAVFVLMSAIGLVKGPAPLTRGPAASAIDRRCMVGGLVPLLALQPLASLAADRYLPPGQETEEFKSLDARATAFKRAQMLYRENWEELTDQLMGSKDDAEVAMALAALKKAFRENGEGNLPEGVSRDSFLRQVRRKQRQMEEKGMWDKPVRLQFLDLKTAIDTSKRPKSMSDGPVFG